MRKIGRNEPCPCGSGKKHKHCCLGKNVSLDDKYKQHYGIITKTPQQVQGIKECGKLLLEIMDELEKRIQPGVTTEELNTIAHNKTIEAGAIPAPLNYHGFPKSICTSINDVICHGIPGDEILVDGDIVNIDITPILGGYYADANKTFFVGNPTKEGKKIVDVARESLRRGMEQVRPGALLGDIGYAIQSYAEGEGCSVVREFVGHGVGLDFHEAPQISHVGRPSTGLPLIPGMVFTIEPMINLGRRELYILDDDWTVKTKDGSLSAQFEQTILVTETSFESLTPFPL